MVLNCSILQFGFYSKARDIRGPHSHHAPPTPGARGPRKERKASEIVLCTTPLCIRDRKGRQEGWTGYATWLIEPIHTGGIFLCLIDFFLYCQLRRIFFQMYLKSYFSKLSQFCCEWLKMCVEKHFKYFQTMYLNVLLMVTSHHRGKWETNAGDGGEKCALEMEASQEGK